MKITATFDIYGSEKEINKKISEIKKDLEETNEEFKKKLNKSLLLKFAHWFLKKEQKEIFELLKNSNLIENYKIEEKESYKCGKRYVLELSFNDVWIKYYSTIQEALFIKVLDEKKLKEKIVENLKKDLKKRVNMLIETKVIE
ncbi:MAG: hypothetical protein QW103_02195 [Candidatus Pacearchaeota archaeon]